MNGESDYRDFLASKRLAAEAHGFAVDPNTLPGVLFPWQRLIVAWALQRGRAALFEDTGLGKTLQQVAWADAVAGHTGKPVLILAPLAVADQTAREAREKLGLDVTICRAQKDARPGVNVANYEMLHHFDAAAFGGLVLDESSILKAYDGTMRRRITDFAAVIPFRLACTATPAPNDVTELINHAEFLDVMNGREILALFFRQDGNSAHNWRLKGHAQKDFWRWLASWAVALRTPSDLGFSDAGFVLPALSTEQHTVESTPLEGHLFAVEAQGLSERRKARASSISERVKQCAEMVNASDEPWLIWCDLNAESSALAKAITGAVEVTGSDKPARKSKAMLDFAAGDTRVLVSKPSICGFGMNWQHCRNIAFVGLSDSWEQYYQAIRRCWRFGQTRPVNVHIFTSEAEGAVVANIERKEREASALMDSLVAEVAANNRLALATATRATREEQEYRESVAEGRDWTLYLGDSVLLMDAVESDSVGLSVFSPPFPGMYAYTNSPHDMGNTRDMREMLQQYRYLVGRQNLLRVTMPGRMACVHLTQSPAFKHLDGYVGLKDFRGKVIELMEEEGWIYYGEVTIDKDPQVKAQRTKERGLMFRTLATDSSLMRMAMADYLVYFMKPGQNPRPIRAGRSEKYGNPDGWITNDEWIEWAHPIWRGVRETNVLNVRPARDEEDEKHLCPLQLDVIERAVKLWSAPGDLVLDPFSGIGSTGHTALLHNRRFVGFELKPSYFRAATANLRNAERQASAATLWGAPEEAAV